MRPNAMASAWPSRDRRLRGLAGEAAGGDQHAVPDRAEQHHRRRHVLMVDLGTAGAAGARLDEMQIGEAERIERLRRHGCRAASDPARRCHWRRHRATAARRRGRRPRPRSRPSSLPSGSACGSRSSRHIDRCADWCATAGTARSDSRWRRGSRRRRSRPASAFFARLPDRRRSRREFRAVSSARGVS